MSDWISLVCMCSLIQSEVTNASYHLILSCFYHVIGNRTSFIETVLDPTTISVSLLYCCKCQCAVIPLVSAELLSEKFPQHAQLLQCARQALMIAAPELPAGVKQALLK